MKSRIAIASTDGIVVNQHFGRAGFFIIVLYDDESGTWEYQEKRPVAPVCNRGDHEDGALERNIQAIADCRYLLVSRVGMRARNAIEASGIQVFEIPVPIPDAIDRMIKYIQVQNLVI